MDRSPNRHIRSCWHPNNSPWFYKNQGGPHVNFCKYLTFYFLSYYCAWLDMMISLLPLDWYIVFLWRLFFNLDFMEDDIMSLCFLKFCLGLFVIDASISFSCDDCLRLFQNIKWKLIIVLLTVVLIIYHLLMAKQYLHALIQAIYNLPNFKFIMHNWIVSIFGGSK